jgi:hypothetical protein
MFAVVKNLAGDESPPVRSSAAKAFAYILHYVTEHDNLAEVSRFRTPEHSVSDVNDSLHVFFHSLHRQRV